MESKRKPHPCDLKIEGLVLYYNEILHGWALPGGKTTTDEHEARRVLRRMYRASRGEK
ncbi:MAG: hypothetical protein ABW044_05410 [Cellvibrio sp.]